MASVKNDRKRKKLIKLAVTLIALLIMSILGITIPSEDIEEQGTPSTTVHTNTEQQQTETEDHQKGELILTMIDVGQADSFLLEFGNETALIDCGTNSAGEDIVQYLQQKGITQIDYVFGTHPHDDHMGGMLDVITQFEIGKIIIPNIKEEHAQTNWYKKLIKEIKDGDYQVEYVELDAIYSLGDAEIMVIGPISDPGNEKNNYSTVLKVSFGDNQIIFTGDAETPVEREILQSGQDIQAEILKVGHHGSDTSNSTEWLEAINPTYALISCGLGNKHEHPIEEVMQRFEERGIKVYRTDECGTVVVTITETDINFNCNPGDYLSGTELAEREDVK